VEAEKKTKTKTEKKTKTKTEKNEKSTNCGESGVECLSLRIKRKR